MSFFFGNRSSKTFKPKKNIPEGSHQHELMKHAAATLGSGIKDKTNTSVWKIFLLSTAIQET